MAHVLQSRHAASAEDALRLAERISDDMNVPAGVERALRFLHARGMWYVLSRNEPALSCPDAARKRVRVGTQGIALHDELKSSLGYVVRSGRRHLVAVHCRADQMRDDHRIIQFVDGATPVQKLEVDALERLGMGYGLVNPFVDIVETDEDFDSTILHLFDDSVLLPSSPAGTMFTNAGDHTWGLEFRPEELVRSYTRAFVRVGKVTLSSSSVTVAPPSIGIITGNGPESGIALWQCMNDSIRNKLRARGNGSLDIRKPGDISLPSVFVHSLPGMGLSMELDQREQEVWGTLEGGVSGLCARGATLITLACHTTHYFGPRIQALAAQKNAEFVSMSEVAMQNIAGMGLESLAIVGVRYVAALNSWSSYTPIRNLVGAIETVSESAMLDFHELAFEVKETGLRDGKNLHQKLTHLLDRHIKSRTVLIALTELSLILLGATPKQRKLEKKVLIEPLSLYGAAIADRYLGCLPVPDEG